MEIAAESGLGTTLLGNLMVANRLLATPAVLAIPISRLLLRGMRGPAERMQRRVLWTHGDDWDPTPTGSSGHADTMARCAHHRRDTGRLTEGRSRALPARADQEETALTAVGLT
jgi:hypothetical protein